MAHLRHVMLIFLMTLPRSSNFLHLKQKTQKKTEKKVCIYIEDLRI